MSYAGFWKRVAATVLDIIIVSVGGFVGSIVIFFPWNIMAKIVVTSGRMPLMPLEVIDFFAGFIVGWFYYFSFYYLHPGIDAIEFFGVKFFGFILGFIIGWLCSAVMESSPTQGTLGKMAVGIKVTDLEGKRIGFGKATSRCFGKIVSTIILLIGYVMVAFTQKKQGLHDMMAGCLVVNRKP